MKVVLAHPTGNQFIRALIQAFEKANILEEFDTTIAINEDTWWIALLPHLFKKELLRRNYNLGKEKIWTHPLREFTRMISLKIGFHNLTKHESGWASVDKVFQSFDKAVSERIAVCQVRQGINAVYCIEDGALSTFKRAKELNIKCIYDLPIAYWETVRKLMTTEAERFPHWHKTLGGGVKDSCDKTERKVRELELADLVVVPGNFVRDSLPHWAKHKKVVISPFGTPELFTEVSEAVEKPSSMERPLRILFAGSLGQRKGLADLFAAMKLLNSRNVELVVMGPLLESFSFYKAEFPHLIYEGVRPHHEVLRLMRSCDILCLPSIAEGRALVMQEAMSQGLPIIITRNTGGEDLVIEGKTGFLVPIRSPEAIAEKINWFSENRASVSEMGQAAKKHAAQYTWDQYGKTIADAIFDIVKH